MPPQIFKVNNLFTLEPFQLHGREAIAPDPSIQIVGIFLTKLIVKSRNAFNQVTILIADDLFACAACGGQFYDPIPKNEQLCEAALDILYEGSPEPHAIEIAPPDTLRLQNPADASRILRFLVRRGFQKTEKIILALILTSAAFGATACLADDVDDDGDTESAMHNMQR